jgi:hypothetical protein
MSTTQDTAEIYIYREHAKTNKISLVQRPRYQASVDFNNLEHELKNATSLYNFKKTVKKTGVYEV